METLQRLILIVTLTGLLSNPWLGAIEQPATPTLPADVVPEASITLVSSTRGSTGGRGHPSVAAGATRRWYRQGTQEVSLKT